MYFHHRYIVKYPVDDLVLISATDLDSGSSVAPLDDIASFIGCRRPQIFPFESAEHLHNIVNEMNPFEYKGLVLTHKSTQQRVQILNRLYVSVAYGGDLTTIGSLNLDGELDYVHMFDICKNGYAWKMVLYWPEWSHYATTIAENYTKFCQEIDLLFSAIKLLGETEFAMKCKASFLSSILFRMRQHHHSKASEFLALMAAHHRGFAKHWKEFQTKLKKKDPELIVLQT
jgi:hypothetical protein